jgi:serine/threonine-protein kinase RsbW
MSRESVVRPTLVVPADVERDGGRAFLARLAAMLDPTAGEVALDCSRLRGATSGQIDVLWGARRRCEAAGVPVRLTYVGRGLERVLKVLDIYDLFEVEFRPRTMSEPQPGRTPAASGLTFEAEVKASIEGVSEVMGGFREFLLGLGLPEMEVFDMGTVFYEVATNTREHGGVGERGASHFTAALHDGTMTMRFVDSGRPFDPEQGAPAFSAREAIRRRQNRGIGLVLVRKLVDSICYERIGDQNVVTLEKSMQQPREKAQ